jgi:hypothetical protein
MRATFSFPTFVYHASFRSFATTLCLGFMAIGVSVCTSGPASDNCDERVFFRFTAVPASGGVVELSQVCARGPGSSSPAPPCDDLVVYDLPGSDRFFQFMVGPDQNCQRVFTGKVNDSNGRYFEFTGSYTGDFNDNIPGPFATGAYERYENGAVIQVGTFEFFE